MSDSEEDVYQVSDSDDYEVKPKVSLVILFADSSFAHDNTGLSEMVFT